MTASSTGAQAMARNASQSLLQAVAAQPLSVLADALGVDESVACRIRSGEARVTLHQVGALLDALQKKIVSRDQVCVSRSKYEAMATLLAAAMSDADTTRRLIWEESQ